MGVGIGSHGLEESQKKKKNVACLILFAYSALMHTRDIVEGRRSTHRLVEASSIFSF